jgi:hypothetical protein
VHFNDSGSKTTKIWVTVMTNLIDAMLVKKFRPERNDYDRREERRPRDPWEDRLVFVSVAVCMLYL